MAKQVGILKFTGKLGNLIGYGRGKDFYIRSAAEEVHQTAATRLSARTFGKASKLGKAMRHAMNGLFDGPGDADAVNRLNKALLAVLRADDLYGAKRFIPANFNSLPGLRLHGNASLSKLLTGTPVVKRDADGNLHVTLPAMQTGQCNPQANFLAVKAIAVHVSSAFNTATATASDSILLPVGRLLTPQTLIVPAGKGALSCVFLEVICCSELHGRLYQLHNRAFTATEVIAVVQGPKARVKRKLHLRTRQQQPPAYNGPHPDFHPRE